MQSKGSWNAHHHYLPVVAVPEGIPLVWVVSIVVVPRETGTNVDDGTSDVCTVSVNSMH